MDIVASKEFTDILLDPNKIVVEKSQYYPDSNCHLTELLVDGKAVASRLITSTATTFYANPGAYHG